MSFSGKENQFLKNYRADCAEIFSVARTKKLALNETNPKIFGQLDEELLFYEDLLISLNQDNFSFLFKIAFFNDGVPRSSSIRFCE